MSSPKWMTVNGVRYPVEESKGGGVEESFTYEGQEWDVVQNLTVEEAQELTEGQQRDWSGATDEELMVFTFGFGAARIKGGETGPFVVKLNDKMTELPFGSVDTGALLELVWRKTGADCPGEEAQLELPCGTYHIVIEE